MILAPVFQAAEKSSDMLPSLAELRAANFWSQDKGVASIAPCIYCRRTP